MNAARRLLLALLLALAPHGAVARAPAPPPLFYHIFVRSFADSNGDRQGDLAGIRAHLDYLQGLGVTTLLLTPLYPSPFYHNYFADDFAGLAPEFGTMADFQALVDDLHQRGMTLFLDEEIQYVTGQHAWYRQSHDRPGGPWQGYLLYADAQNHQPVPTLTASNDYFVWPDQHQQIFTVNLANPQVRGYFTANLADWARRGVDGFRIDHMMDDLDNRHVLPGLFARFWAPMLADLRAGKPGLRFLAEQADWGDGQAFLQQGTVDMVFAFPIWKAAQALDAAGFAAAVTRARAVITPGHDQLVFIENHDTERFAQGARNTPAIRRFGAALTMLTGWTPSLYYGQEIGMGGARSRADHRAGQPANSDAQDIGLRQAFRWQPDPLAPGNAAWYRRFPAAYTQPDANHPGDGVSVAEQTHDPRSLLNRYRQLAALRAHCRALATGSTRVVGVQHDLVLIERRAGHARALVLFNFGARAQRARFAMPFAPSHRWFGAATAKSGQVHAPAYSATVWTNRS